jgi:hypothetical protein
VVQERTVLREPSGKAEEEVLEQEDEGEAREVEDGEEGGGTVTPRETLELYMNEFSKGIQGYSTSEDDVVDAIRAVLEELSECKGETWPCLFDHPPEPQYTEWCQAGKPDVQALLKENERLRDVNKRNAAPRCEHCERLMIGRHCISCSSKESLRVRLVRMNALASKRLFEIDAARVYKREAVEHWESLKRAETRLEAALAKIRLKTEILEASIPGTHHVPSQIILMLRDVADALRGEENSDG